MSSAQTATIGFRDVNQPVHHYGLTTLPLITGTHAFKIAAPDTTDPEGVDINTGTIAGTITVIGTGIVTGTMTVIGTATMKRIDTSTVTGTRIDTSTVTGTRIETGTVRGTRIETGIVTRLMTRMTVWLFIMLCTTRLKIATRTLLHSTQ